MGYMNRKVITTKDEEAFRYLELEELPNDSRVEPVLIMQMRLTQRQFLVTPPES